MARAWGVAPGVFYGERAANSEWTDKDRTWALALAEVESGECSECPQPLDEAFDGSVVWECPPPMRCHSCTAVADRASQYHDTPHASALRFHPVRRA